MQQESSQYTTTDISHKEEKMSTGYYIVKPTTNIEIHKYKHFN